MSKKKILRYIRNPLNIISYFGARGKLSFLPDSFFLKLLFRERMNKKLNIKTPKTYNEKLQWLKINNRNPQYTNMVDKYEVRNYIAETIGEEYLIPLLGVYDKFDDINFNDLPNEFVLKCTHDSGGLIVCKDKLTLDKDAAKRKINKSLQKNFYFHGREWPYKNIVPRIICEKYMVDESGTELKDYKFFCFDGVPKALFVATNRGVDTRFDFFDMEFNHLPIMQHYKNSDTKIKKPKGFNQMIELAKKLSKGMPHVRIDFYDINGRIYFGEITFYHFSGLEKFEPEIYDEIFGEWIELSI